MYTNGTMVEQADAKLYAMPYRQRDDEPYTHRLALPHTMHCPRCHVAFTYRTRVLYADIQVECPDCGARCGNSRAWALA